MANELKTSKVSAMTTIEYFFAKMISPQVAFKEEYTTNRIYLCTEGTIFLILYLAKELNYTNAVITLLKEQEYSIDSYGNVILNTKEEKTILMAKDLIDLLKRLEHKIYPTIFQFSKFKNALYNEKILESYLAEVKLFGGNLSSDLENPDYESIVRKTRNIVTAYQSIKEVKVNDLIQDFINALPNAYHIKIKKIKLQLKEKKEILKRVKEQPDFYTLSLGKQQEVLGNWLVEYYNSNKRNMLIAQKAILTLGEENTQEITPIILPGLLILYTRLLEKIKDFDYDSISLSGIEILSYESKEMEEIKIQIASLQAKINAILKNDPTSIEKQRILAEKKMLDSTISQERTKSAIEITTNNNLKMKEFYQNMAEGVITFEEKTKIFNIRNTSPKTGKLIFEAKIKLEDLYEIMKCISGNLSAPNFGFHN